MVNCQGFDQDFWKYVSELVFHPSGSELGLHKRGGRAEVGIRTVLAVVALKCISVSARRAGSNQSNTP